MEGIDFKLYSSCIKHETTTFSSKQLQQKMQKFGAKVNIKTLKQWVENDMTVPSRILIEQLKNGYNSIEL